jgi:hypothetical protein
MKLFKMIKKNLNHRRSNRQDTGLEHCAHHSKHWDDEQEIRLKMFKIIKNGKRGEK